MIRLIFPFLFLFFSSLSFAEEKEDPDKLVQCFGRFNCRTAYSDAGASIKLARGAGHIYCGSVGYDACSGIIHYCGSKLSDSSSAPSTVGVFVHARWSAYKVWDLEKREWETCTLDFQGGEGDLTPEYNKPPTDEICLSRPVLDGMTFPGVYKGDDGTRYVNVQGCIYEATGNPFICNPDDDTVCTANWKPVAVDPAFSDDKEDGGSSGGGSSGGGNSGGGSSGGGSSGGGNSGGGSSSGDGWLGDILGWLQRIWVSVNDLNNAFSVSQADITSAVSSYDSQLNELIHSVTPEQDDMSSFADRLFSLLPDEWLYINFDKLLLTGELRRSGAQPVQIEFPGINGLYFTIDTSDFASVYDDIIRPLLEYALYALTTLRCYFIVRRVLFVDRG
ncbi:hypothetical protein Q2V60_26030 [Escherichia coli]|uniref:hypothetical protein n=1 Tax=Escherichia coli TaxID=562 RepID=UPI0026660334|nr:hypothetical protein [Escherichia coli]MDO2896338.1 hypothetical protein [Escherichia coli]